MTSEKEASVEVNRKDTEVTIGADVDGKFR